jgi:hypothetical protein
MTPEQSFEILKSIELPAEDKERIKQEILQGK